MADRLLEPSEFRSLVESLTSQHDMYSSNQIRQMHGINVALQSVSTSKRVKMINANRHRALADIYMNDGWTSKVASTTASASGNTKTKVKGSFRQEFGQQRCVLRSLPDPHTSKLIIAHAPPGAMKKGKSAEHFFAVGCDWHTPLKAQGHQGVSTTLYVFDGHLCDSQGRLFKGRHGVLFDPRTGVFNVEQVLLLLHLDWVLVMRCKVHQAHKSIEWSLKPFRGAGSGRCSTYWHRLFAQCIHAVAKRS